MRCEYLAGVCAVQYPDERIFPLHPAILQVNCRLLIRMAGIL